MLSYFFVLCFAVALLMLWGTKVDKQNPTSKFMWVVLAVIIAIPSVSPFFFEFGDTKWGMGTLLSFDEEKKEVRSHPFALWDPPFGNKKWVKVPNKYLCEAGEGRTARFPGLGGHLYRFPVIRTSGNVVTVVDVSSSVCISDPWAFYQRAPGVETNTDGDGSVVSELANMANWVAAQGLPSIESKLPEFRSLLHLTTNECLIEAGPSISADACRQIGEEVKAILTPFLETPGLRVETRVSLRHFGLD